jgi:hypothetical protein
MVDLSGLGVFAAVCKIFSKSWLYWKLFEQLFLLLCHQKSLPEERRVIFCMSSHDGVKNVAIWPSHDYVRSNMTNSTDVRLLPTPTKHVKMT